MRRFLIASAVVLALVALPAASRAAASPCAGPAPMDCCAGMGDDGAPPCGCTLNPVPPAPAAVDAAAAPATVVAEAAAPAAAVDAPAPAAAPGPVAPRARSAPLHLFHSVLLV